MHSEASVGHGIFLKFAKNDQKRPELDKKGLFGQFFADWTRKTPKTPPSHPQVTPKSPSVFINVSTLPRLDEFVSNFVSYFLEVLARNIARYRSKYFHDSKTIFSDAFTQIIVTFLFDLRTNARFSCKLVQNKRRAKKQHLYFWIIDWRNADSQKPIL